MQRDILRVVSRVPGADAAKRAGAKVRATAARSAKKAAIGLLAVAGLAGLAWATSPSSPTALAAAEIAVIVGEIPDEGPDGTAAVTDAVAGTLPLFAERLETVPLPSHAPRVINADDVAKDAEVLSRSYVRMGGTIIIPPIVLTFLVMALVRVLAYVHETSNVPQLYMAALLIVSAVMIAIAAMTDRKQNRAFCCFLAMSFIFVDWSGALGVADAAQNTLNTLNITAAPDLEAWIGSVSRHTGDVYEVARALVTMGRHSATGALALGVTGYMGSLDLRPIVARAWEFLDRLAAEAVVPFAEGGMPPALANRTALAISWIDGDTKRKVEAILADKNASPKTRSLICRYIQHNQDAALTAIGELGNGAAGAAWAHPSSPHAVDTRGVLALINADGALHEAPWDVHLGELASILTASDTPIAIPTTWSLLSAMLADAPKPNQSAKPTGLFGAGLLLERFAAQDRVFEVAARHVARATHVAGSITLPALSAGIGVASDEARGAITINLIDVLRAIGSGAVPVPLGYAFGIGISSRGAYEHDLVAGEVAKMHDGAEKSAVVLMTQLRTLVGDLAIAFDKAGEESKQEIAGAIADGSALLDFFAGVEDKLSWLSENGKPRMALLGASLASALDEMESTQGDATRTKGAWRVVALVRQISSKAPSRSDFWMSLSSAVTERPEFTAYLLLQLETAADSAQASYNRNVARHIDSLNKTNFSSMAAIASRTPVEMHLFHSIYLPPVEAAKRVLVVDHARNLAREQTAKDSQPDAISQKQTERDVLEEAKQAAGDSDPELAKFLNAAVQQAFDNVDKQLFADEMAEARAEKKSEREVAATLLAWIARPGGIWKEHCVWNTELISWVSSGALETANIGGILKGITKLAPFTDAHNADFTAQVIAVLDAIKPAQTDVATSCGSALTSAENLLKSRPWLSGKSELTEEQSATKLIYDALRVESGASACANAKQAAADSAKTHARRSSAFDKEENSLRVNRARSGTTQNGIALELIKVILYFRQDGNAGLAIANSWRAHLNMWTSSRAVNTPEFAEVARELLTHPRFQGDNLPFTKKVIDILNATEAPAAHVPTADGYRAIISAWGHKETVAGATDVAELSEKLRESLKNAQLAAQDAQDKKSMKFFDKEVEKAIKQNLPMPEQVSWLVALIALEKYTSAGHGPWFAQHEVWKESGLLTQISHKLLGEIFRAVLTLPRFKEGINPKQVALVIPMIDAFSAPDAATAGTVDTAESIKTVLSELDKLTADAPQCAAAAKDGDTESHTAQACEATRLIRTMLLDAIKKCNKGDAAELTTEAAAFGAAAARARRTRKQEPRRFL